MVMVFEECELEYPDKGLDKPIRYSESFLKECFSNAKNVPLVEEHTSNQLCVLEDFNVHDGEVHSNIPEGIDITGLGFSPTFFMNYIDRGDYYEPVDMELKSIGLTKNPRNQIFYNSIDDKRSGNMSGNSDALETALNRQRELEKEVASLETQLNSQKSAIKKMNSLEKQVKELTENNNELSSMIEEYTPKVEKYDKYTTDKREELLDKISNGSEELRKKFEDFSFEHLAVIAEQQMVNTKPKGVSSNASEGDGLGEQHKSDEYSYDEFKDDFKAAFGEEPSFKF